MIALTSIANSLGLTGVFASRVFLPAFIAALIVRFGPSVRWLESLGILKEISEETVTWFTSDTALIILGLLALGEFVIHKLPEIREMLINSDQYVKPLIAALTYFGITPATENESINEVLARVDTGDYFFVFLIMVGTFLVAGSHNKIVQNISEVDDTDDVGLMKSLSWLQNSWSVFGVLFVVLFPAVMSFLILIFIGFIMLLRKRIEAKEENSKIKCSNCSYLIYRCAIFCPNCKTKNQNPLRLNWLGGVTSEPVANPKTHALEMLSNRRCRVCGSRLLKRKPQQSCPVCKNKPFKKREAVKKYDQMISNRIPNVLIICTAFSFIPIFGLIPGVIYYRILVVAPYNRYIGQGRSVFLKWSFRVVAFFLMMIQWIPIIGAVSVPAMAWINFSLYRRSFIKDALKESEVK